MKTIKLTRGKVALVDDDDFELVSKFKWQAHFDPRNGKWYAVRSYGPKKNRKTVSMHRTILDHQAEHTDHKDGDGLNNQKLNLRPATRAQNGQNRKLQKHSARFKGVHHFKANGTWTASIRVNKKKKHLGYFGSPGAAAKAYDTAALKHFGEFARTNQQIGDL